MAAPAAPAAPSYLLVGGGVQVELLRLGLGLDGDEVPAGRLQQEGAGQAVERDAAQDEDGAAEAELVQQVAHEQRRKHEAQRRARHAQPHGLAAPRPEVVRQRHEGGRRREADAEAWQRQNSG